MVPINHVCRANAILERDWLALRWHMQGFLGYGRWTNSEPTVGNELSWPDEKNDIGLTSFVGVGPTKLPTKCQRWPNTILEREWLALRWHMQGFLVYGRWTNIELAQ